MSTTTVTVEGVEIEVEYTFFKFRRGARDSFMGKRGAGPQLEPDEPSSVDLEKVSIGGQEVYDLLSQSTIDSIAEKVMESINEDCYEDYDER